jgi:hypothetical protein
MDVVLACIVGVPVYDPLEPGSPANDNIAPPAHQAGYRDGRRHNVPRGYPDLLGPAIY